MLDQTQISSLACFQIDTERERQTECKWERDRGMSGREKRKETEKTFFLSELIWLPTDIHCLCRTQTLPFSNVKSFTMIGSWCIKRKVCHWSVPEQDAVTTCWELAARFKKEHSNPQYREFGVFCYRATGLQHVHSFMFSTPVWITWALCITRARGKNPPTNF